MCFRLCNCKVISSDQHSFSGICIDPYLATQISGNSYQRESLQQDNQICFESLSAFLVDTSLPKYVFVIIVVIANCPFLALTDRDWVVDMRRDVQEIFKLTPHDKQVMMFSATLSKEIRPVCKRFMQDVMSCSHLISSPILDCYPSFLVLAACQCPST